MKKLWTLLSIFLVLGLAVCMGIGFATPVSAGVPKSSVSLYKLLSGFENFMKFLPAIMVTSFVITCSVQFGRNPEGSSSRFSKAMADRYKGVIITSLIIAFVFTLCVEIFGVLIAQKKQSIVNQPKLINEYVKVGNNLFENGYYDRAMRYADAALALDSNYTSASELKEKAEVESTRTKTSNIRFKLYESVQEAEKVERVKIDAKQINEVYQLYLKSQEAFEKKEWFNAHYYAELGLNLATPKDSNLEGLKKLSTSAWNNLTEYHNLAKTEGQLAFDKKYQGYLALVEKDDLKAYYIFRELYLSSREFQSDPDVVFYMQVAENRINERYFFIDETLELESFENANDVYFAYSYEDGSKDIVYFKGMTTVKDTGNSIQYLRDLTVSSIDTDGNLFRTMNVPYAKVLPVSVKTLTPTTKSLMGISDKIDYVPYIMLKSVGREKPNTEIKPTYKYANATEDDEIYSPDYMLLSIPYADFLMIEEMPKEPSGMSITSLFKLINKVSDYGYSSQIYGIALMNRILYPLILLCMFILLGVFAWNNRIGINQYFKFSWLFAFPAFLLTASVFYKATMFVFHLINFTLVSNLDFSLGFMVGAAIYVFMFIVVSIDFLARNSKI